MHMYQLYTRNGQNVRNDTDGETRSEFPKFSENNDLHVTHAHSFAFILTTQLPSLEYEMRFLHDQIYSIVELIIDTYIAVDGFCWFYIKTRDSCLFTSTEE